MMAPQEVLIQLPARAGVPATQIFTKQFLKKHLGERNTIVLLPGGPGNDMSMYDDPSMSIAQTFFEAADVILFDPRACGRSQPCPVEFCALDHYIDDVEAIRQYFNLEADHFFVFGQSYGSIAALGYAVRYPKRLKKLLLIGAIASSDFYKQAQSELKRIASPEQIVFAEKLWNGSFDGSKEEVADFYKLMSPLYVYSFEPGEPPLEVQNNIDVMNFGWGNFLQSFDYTDKLRDVCCETLILWGENEWIMPRAQLDLVSQSIPHATIKTYSECMHMLWVDQWDRFVEDALGFLSEGARFSSRGMF